MSEQSGLPTGWNFITLPDIVENSKDSIKRGPFGSSIRKEFFVPSGYKVYQQKNVIRNDFEWGDYFIDKEKFSKLRNFELRSGDIVITCSGTIGRIAIVPKDIRKGIINQALLKITLDNRIVWSKYFFYLFKSEVHEILASSTRGSTMKNISSVRRLKEISFPLPPFPEQKRIVDKIEELFTKLEAGVASLENVKAQLQLYRQAVLKHAFAGRLTEEWRKTKRHKDETGQRLLQKIRQERRQGWEENLRALGRDPQKFKYKEPFLPSEIENLPSIPLEWTYASADELSVQITDGEHITPKRQKEGIYLLSARNVLNGRLLLDDVDFISEREYDRIKRRVKPDYGDVLLTCSGSVGRSCVVPEGLKFQMVRSVAIIKPLKELVNGKFLSYALMSNNLQSQINRKKTQTAQSNIFQGRIKRLAFPLAPLPEQLEIVEKIEDYFSVADIVEKNVEVSLLRSDILRQGVFKAAFEGRLVAQDPADEPAGKLLERIREEKEKLKDEGKRSKTLR